MNRLESVSRQGVVSRPGFLGIFGSNTMTSTENTSRKKRSKVVSSSKGNGFKSGPLGNAQGKRKNQRSEASVLVQSLIDREAEAITRKVIERAKEGDITALKICMDRLSLTGKRRQMPVELRLDRSAKSVARANKRVFGALVAGKIDMDEAKTLKGLLDSVLLSIEYEEFERDLNEIKRRVDSL